MSVNENESIVSAEEGKPLDINPLHDFIGGLEKKIASPQFQKTIVSTVGSIILAMLIAALVMMMTGYNPLLAYLALIRGAIVQWAQVWFNATPLILTGLSVAFAFKCGLFNIGAEGQVYVGSLAATVTGYAISLPIVIHPIAALAVGAFVGGLWGFIPGLLRAYRGAHEVVTTMMLSYTAILLTHWLVAGPLLEPGNQYILQTPLIKGTAELPFLSGNFLSWAFIVALGAVLGVDILLNRTVIGYEMRAVGSNLEAAEYGGISAKAKMALSLGIAGALSGLAGAGQILGYHHRFIDGWSSGLGWDGITVAVIGANNPWGVLMGALFFGALNTGGRSMQRIAGVPSEMVTLIQGLIVVFVAAPRIMYWLADRGIEQAKWMKENPRIAMPHFISMAITLVTSLIGFTLVGSYITVHFMASGLVMVATGIGFPAAVLMLTNKRLGLKIGIVAGLFWLSVAVVGLTVSNMAVLLTSLILGGLTIIFDLISFNIVGPEEAV
ncbi:MAG: ABC transporter permease [Promethearchaeia archaeon]